MNDMLGSRARTGGACVNERIFEKSNRPKNDAAVFAV